MSQQQWGHGFNKGLIEGIGHATDLQEWGTTQMLAEQVNMLVRNLAVVMDSEHHDAFERWSIIHTLFDVTRPYLADPKRAQVPKLNPPNDPKLSHAD